MNYAFEFHGKGFTPDGSLVAAADILKHNAEQEEKDLARLKAGVPIVVYPSGLCMTLWTGRPVGSIVKRSAPFHNPFGFHSTMTAYTWRDYDGNLWHGRGAGEGMSLSSRRSKGGAQ